MRRSRPAALLFAGMYGSAGLAMGELPMYTGIVTDKDSGRPIEGAYAVASYYEEGRAPGVTKQLCRKTKGMVTGPDGKFSFPVEKRDGLSPAFVTAIKPGYYIQYTEYPDTTPYSNRRVLLKKQDERNPEFLYQSGDQVCTSAKSSADVTASVRFLEIERQERIRLHDSQGTIESVEGLIESLKMIDSRVKAKGSR